MPERALEDRFFDDAAKAVVLRGLVEDDDLLGPYADHHLVPLLEPLPGEALDQHALGGPHHDAGGAGLDHGSFEDVRRADELENETARRVVVDVGRASKLLDRALIDDGDPVGQRQRFLLVVGDVDEGDADVALDARPAD
jgi:hypothetical protein